MVATLAACMCMTMMPRYAAAAAPTSGAVRARDANQVCDVTKYGAVGDGKTVNTKAIQAAIDACSASGGGTVCVLRSAACEPVPVTIPVPNLAGYFLPQATS